VRLVSDDATVVEGRGPDRAALTGFAALVVIGGLNFPAVKATVEELEPMWSAGVRFAAAALILTAVVLIRRHPLPKGRALAGTVLFGALSFAATYGFIYWGIARVPAGTASVLLASVPLVTFAAAVAHRLEPFRWLTLAGGLLAVAGIAVMVGGRGTGSISLAGLLALLAGAMCGAEAAIVAKRFPPVAPITMNAIAMSIGAVVLLALSFASGESHSVPRRASTWTGLIYLVAIGSIVLFVVYLFVLRRWTASGTSYIFVLFPMVAVIFAALFQDERITAGLVVGGILVVSGVYVGALLHVGKREPRATEAAEPPTAQVPVEEARPEIAGVPADCLRCP
jgi:drug/metabolite transporter (DMT)-like permease